MGGRVTFSCSIIVFFLSKKPHLIVPLAIPCRLLRLTIQCEASRKCLGEFPGLLKNSPPSSGRTAALLTSGSLFNRADSSSAGWEGGSLSLVPSSSFFFPKNRI
mmetsp:Transcript_43477/g.116344  ORF Transcript_43477/g.116344 Transcript_43477/m.116344 type:complete len:104 (+) Transcript_43477:75-386(+)